MRVRVPVIALLLAFAGGGHAQTAEELKEMAVLSYFVEKQAWLNEAKPIGGISDRENEAIVAIIRSLKRQLDELQAEAPKYAKENRGREYFKRRRALLLSGKKRLKEAISAPAWEKLSAYLDEIGKRLMGAPAPTRK